MLRKIQKSLTLAFIFLVWTGVIRSFAQQVADGKRTFASTCAACHGLDGKGAERGPDIANRRAIQRLPDASLSRIVREGKPGTGMPPFRSLGEPRIQAVVRYLRTLQGQGKAASLPGDPTAGKVLFFGKAQCSNCHMTNGEGGFIASDLSAYAAGKTTPDIRGAITEPNKNLDPRKRTVVVKTADGTTHTGMARNEDNFSLQLQTLDGRFHFFNKAELQSTEHQPESLMPADYQSKLTAQELDNLVSYLMRIAQNRPKPDQDKEKE
jgi:cytochrome c oxidase cbb3-type subunit III